MNKSLINKIELGNRINNARIKSGYSIAQLGEKIGVKKGTVDSWRRGLCYPPEQKILKIAMITDTPVEWLLWGDNYESLPYCPNCKQPILKKPM